MRIGKNPNNGQLVDSSNFNHQVVIPVFIPNQEGYFKDGLKILQLCISSIMKTSHTKTFITVVNNGSCTEVVNYLQNEFDNNEIHELIHTNNIGKINAIFKGVIGHKFDYVTISDADVLFLTNWQDETYKIYKNYPKAGVVGLVPQFKLYHDLCSNILFDYFFSKKLRFTKVKNPDALKMFYRSIGWAPNYNQDFLKMNLTLESKDSLLALVGSGHLVATYNYDTVKHFNTQYCSEKMGKSLRKHFDKSAIIAGRYRLTTNDNFAYHMGNVFESWMNDVLLNLQPFTGKVMKNHQTKIKSSRITFFIKNQVFRKILEYKPFINWFIKFKGLPKEVTKTHWHV
jgi:hypothetical protein